ncbi:hypothetical protein [Prevotella fusca]
MSIKVLLLLITLLHHPPLSLSFITHHPSSITLLYYYPSSPIIHHLPNL